MSRFHQDFRLNGYSFSSDIELLDYVKEISTSIYNFLVDWFSSDDFVVVQTSGSTGKPKPIQLKKEFMINSAKATGKFFKLRKRTRALLCLPTDFIAGKMMLIRSLTLGWSLDIVAPTSTIKIDKEYDFSAMVPLQLRNSINEIHKIKKLIVGGGVVANDLVELIQNISTEVFATYGMTETITHIAVKKLNNYSQNEFLKTCYYKILPDVKIYIDKRNCLAIHAEKISNEFIITNDVVQLISDTEFEWLGRFDTIINSGGIKLHPEKIEEKLSAYITNRFFVAGVLDAVLGEKLILVVEGKEEEIDLQKIDSLSRFEYPKKIYFVDKFIETDTAKIQRKKTLNLLFK